MGRGRYRLNARAQRQAETRARITRATVELHATVGPARTTVAEVARRAGVDRLTVYRHFPTRRDLFTACSSYAQSVHPAPDPDVWASIEDPRTRLEVALRALYAFYAENEGLLGNVMRDAETLPLVRDLAAPRRLYVKRVKALLSTGWSARGRRGVVLGASIGHAVEFATWRSLVRQQGLNSTEAAQFMAAAATSCLAPAHGRHGR